MSEARIEELSQEVAHLQQALDNMLMPVMISSEREGDILYVNTKGAELFRTSPQELIGQKLANWYVDLKDREAALKIIKESGKLVDYEVCWHYPNGELFWVKLSSNPILFNGESALVVVLADITAQRKMRDDLKYSEKRFFDVVQNIPIGMYFYELRDEGRLVLMGANPAADRLVGLDNSQFIGKTIEEAFPPLAQTEVPERYRRAAELGEYWHTEQVSYESDQISGAFEVDAFQAGARRMVASFLNITERKKTEEMLLQEKAFSELVINNLPGIFYLLDMEGKFVRWNKNLEKVTGYSAEEVGNQPALNVIAAADRPAISQAIQTVFVEGGIIVEGRLLAKDGTETPYYFTASRIMMNGKPHLIGTGIDNSERIRSEEERTRLQEEIILAQQRSLKELSTPIIPIMDQIIVMPLIGAIDSMRAKDLTRAVLNGISEYRARVIILDITGVPLVDSGVAAHLNKAMQAARLKGAMTIITGVSDAVAETIVDLGIDWSGIETLRDLQTGLLQALRKIGAKLE